MSKERITSFAWGLFEFLPLLIFVYLGRFGSDFSERFLWGGGAAIVVLLSLAVAQRRLNPLVVAANLWLILEGFAFVVYIPALANTLLWLRETAFFLVIVIVGAPFTFLSKSGLFRSASQDLESVRRYSLLLLGVAAAGAVWAFVNRGDKFVAASLPAIVLFVLQAILATRLKPASPRL